MKRLAGVCFVAAYVFFFVLTANAQLTATITGTVSDSTGAVLPGASVIALNEDTGISRTVEADAAGRYSALVLPLGNYRVTASLAGFQTEVRSGIALTVGRQAVVNFELPVGVITQTVEVTGEAPLVETRKGSMGEVIESATITELPLNGRDLAQLITLQTGTLHYTGTRRTGEGGKQMVIGGSRPTTNVFIMDGVAIETYNQKTPTGTSGQFLGVDAIREFKVESNAYSAEFGRGSGGQINIATKNGTNTFHGTAFAFHRNDNMDAAQWEDNAFGVPKPEFKRNQYGFSLGGPIVQDRTFFFGTYEGLRERLGETNVSRTFGAEIRTNPAAFGLPDIDPVVAPYLQLWPLPNGEDLGDGTGRFNWAFSQPTNEDFYQIRVDHQLSDNHSFFVRGTITDSDQLLSGSFPRYTVPELVVNNYWTISETGILSPTLVNTVRFGFTRADPFEGAEEDPPVDPSLRFIPGVEQMGDINLRGTVSGVGNGVTGDGRIMNSFQWVNDSIWTKGAHTLKFGINWNRLQFNGFNPPRDAGNYRFDNIEDFFTVNVDRFRGGIIPGFNDPYRSFRENIIGLYVNDDFQVTPRLTLNLGLRYEFITVPVENHGRVSALKGDINFIQQATIDDFTTGNPWFDNPSLKNFAPRIGFAWDVSGNGTAAVRGGFGIFHLQFNQTWIRTAGFRAPPFLVEIQGTRNVPFPNIFELCSNEDPYNPTNPACSGRPSPDMVPHKFRTPYVMQYNLNVQKQLTQSTVLTVGYAGSKGITLPAVADLNSPVLDLRVGDRIGFTEATIDNGRPNPNFDDIRYRFPSVGSFYHSLQLSLKRSFRQGFQFGASYTFSKNVDDLSGNQTAGDTQTGPNWLTHYSDHTLYRSASAFDVKHNISFNSTYELPIGPGKMFGSGLTGVAEKILGGWQLGGILSLRTGFPGTVLIGSRMTGIGIRNDYPDLVAGFSNNPTEGVSGGCEAQFDRGSVAAGQTLGTPELYYDPCAFVRAPGDGRSEDSLLGNLGRNTVRMPGLATLDLSLTKNTQLSENVNLQFKFETFNLTNRVNFWAPELSVMDRRGRLDSDAGRITDTNSTARQLQFGLKLVF